MSYLLLSIISSTVLLIIFRLFKTYGVHTLVAIVVNYVVAFIYGMAYANMPSPDIIYKKPWFFTTIILGLLFIWVFHLMAQTTQRNGLSVASVAGKMSVVLPVIAAVIIYGDPLNGLKIIAIFTALVAVYLSSVKQKKIYLSGKYFIFPLLLFLSSGFIDILMNYIEKRYLNPQEISMYSASIFGFAAIFGIGYISYKNTKTPVGIKAKDIIGGIFLGIPNYYSAYFLLNALNSEVYSSSTIFIINNIGIVLLSTLLSIVLFRERLILKNWLGIVLALLSIFLVALSK